MVRPCFFLRINADEAITRAELREMRSVLVDVADSRLASVGFPKDGFEGDGREVVPDVEGGLHGCSGGVDRGCDCFALLALSACYSWEDVLWGGFADVDERAC